VPKTETSHRLRDKGDLSITWRSTCLDAGTVDLIKAGDLGMTTGVPSMVAGLTDFGSSG
jgi:hypothetical protein